MKQCLKASFDKSGIESDGIATLDGTIQTPDQCNRFLAAFGNAGTIQNFLKTVFGSVDLHRRTSNNVREFGDLQKHQRVGIRSETNALQIESSFVDFFAERIKLVPHDLPSALVCKNTHFPEDLIVEHRSETDGDRRPNLRERDAVPLLQGTFVPVIES